MDSRLKGSITEIIKQAVMSRPGMFRVRTRSIASVAEGIAESVCSQVEQYTQGLAVRADPEALERKVRGEVLAEVEDALMELNPKAGRRKSLEAVRGIEGYEPRGAEGAE